MTSDLPPTAAVRAVMEWGEHEPATQDELGRILAHCLIRDEVDRLKVASARRPVVADLSDAVHRWIGRGVFSVRTANVLFNAGLYCMADAWALGDLDLLRVKNLGRVCLNEIKALRAAIGTVTDAELNAAMAKRPTYKEAHLAMITRAAVADV